MPALHLGVRAQAAARRHAGADRRAVLPGGDAGRQRCRPAAQRAGALCQRRAGLGQGTVSRPGRRGRSSRGRGGDLAVRPGRPLPPPGRRRACRPRLPGLRQACRSTPTAAIASAPSARRRTAGARRTSTSRSSSASRELLTTQMYVRGRAAQRARRALAQPARRGRPRRADPRPSAPSPTACRPTSRSSCRQSAPAAPKRSSSAQRAG